MSFFQRLLPGRAAPPFFGGAAPGSGEVGGGKDNGRGWRAFCRRGRRGEAKSMTFGGKLGGLGDADWNARSMVSLKKSFSDCVDVIT